MPRPRRITLRIGEPLRFDEVRNGKAGWMEIRDRLESAVGNLSPGDPAE